MGGRNVPSRVLEATEVGHALHMMTTLISSVEGHIEELLIDGLWPEDLWASVRKSAGTCHIVVQSQLVHLALQIVGHDKIIVCKLDCEVSN